MESNLNIVFVSRELGIKKNTGGIGSYVWDLSNELVKKGNNVTIITSSYSDTEKKIAIRGINIIQLKDPQIKYNNFFKNPIKYWKAYFKYREIVAKKLDELYVKNNIDLVEFAEFGAESLLWNKKAPMIIRWHTPLGKELSIKKMIFFPVNKYNQYLELKCLKKADCITFPSEWMKEKVAEKIDINKYKNYVIENGINFSEWEFSEINKSKKDTVKIVYAGTLVARKGFVELIEACRRLRENGIDLELLLIGKGSAYSNKILNKTNDYKWLNMVGVVEREKLKEYYYNADICCFPSWFETVGIVCLEAMATGGITVTTKNGGMSEIIRDGENGFLVEPKNITQLYNCLLNIINLPEEQKIKIKTAAIETIRKRIDNSVIISKYIYICKELIGGN